MQRTVYPASAAAISYTFLRHLGLMLDELSAQGLILWQDGCQAWHWAWTTTPLHSERGFWALGEAVVDAVAARHPQVFDASSLEEGQ